MQDQWVAVEKEETLANLAPHLPCSLAVCVGFMYSIDHEKLLLKFVPGSTQSIVILIVLINRRAGVATRWCRRSYSVRSGSPEPVTSALPRPSSPRPTCL
jgi:hypothetical protein